MVPPRNCSTVTTFVARGSKGFATAMRGQGRVSMSKQGCLAKWYQSGRGPLRDSGQWGSMCCQEGKSDLRGGRDTTGRAGMTSTSSSGQG